MTTPPLSQTAHHYHDRFPGPGGTDPSPASQPPAYSSTSDSGQFAQDHPGRETTGALLSQTGEGVGERTAAGGVAASDELEEEGFAGSTGADGSLGGEPAGELALSGEPLSGAGGPIGAEGGASSELSRNENSARRDEDAVAASDTVGATGPERAAAAAGAGGAGGSRFAESGMGGHAGPRLAKRFEATGRERELAARSDALGQEGQAGEGQAGEGGGDYVPEEREGVYTAPHGYPTTGAQQPTVLNKHPLAENVKSVPEGGIALHGKEGLPEGKPGAIDRIVGKVQQEVGQQTNNWEMYGKGVLREAGGAKAAKGEARAVV